MAQGQADQMVNLLICFIFNRNLIKTLLNKRLRQTRRSRYLSMNSANSLAWSSPSWRNSRDRVMKTSDNKRSLKRWSRKLSLKILSVKQASKELWKHKRRYKMLSPILLITRTFSWSLKMPRSRLIVTLLWMSTVTSRIWMDSSLAIKVQPFERDFSILAKERVVFMSSTIKINQV